MKLCARCQQWINPDEPYETRDVFSPTGPGSTVFLHKHLCKRPPSQTYPAR